MTNFTNEAAYNHPSTYLLDSTIRLTRRLGARLYLYNGLPQKHPLTISEACNKTLAAETHVPHLMGLAPAMPPQRGRVNIIKCT
jgi:hypothetical protein